MSWIKRNLYFLVGAIVSVALLGLAGFYCYSEWDLNKNNGDKLGDAYTEWGRLTSKPRNAGSGSVDNIALAHEQEAQVRQVIQKMRRHFAPVPPIPNPTRGISGLEFGGALRRTLAEMQQDAERNGVAVPKDYSFSFEAERPQYNFESASLVPLAEQLGDVKVICDVLFRAKINRLTGIRREPVSAYDKGSQSDYLNYPAVTNDLAVLAPYEVTFESFSGELADVLAGFANQPYGFIVKAVNVEPGQATSTEPQTAEAPVTYNYMPQPANPNSPGRYAADPYARGRATSAREAYLRAAQQRRTYQQPVPVAAPTTAARSGPTVVLQERPLEITMLVVAVRMRPGS